MNKVKAGTVQAVLKDGPGRDLLFGNLFGNEDVVMDISWGDISSDDDTILLSVCLHKTHMESDPDSDDRQRAWAEYLDGHMFNMSDEAYYESQMPASMIDDIVEPNNLLESEDEDDGDFAESD